VSFDLYGYLRPLPSTAPSAAPTSSNTPAVPDAG
jgi:hypothetical protein